MIKFAAYEVSLEINSLTFSVAERIRRRSRSLADQIERAAQSIPLNIAEGNRRSGRDRLHSFRIAAGSADEVRACIDVARCWRILTAEEALPLGKLLDRQLALLRGLTRN